MVITTTPDPDQALLRLMQLVSPALPVGAFSYSEGLEALQQAGELGSAAALQAWLQAELQRGSIAIETAALSELMQLIARLRAGEHSAAEALAERDGWLLAQREAAEIFGGGVNAFSRYETGKTKPPLALVKLLKVLDKHPELLAEIRA